MIPHSRLLPLPIDHLTAELAAYPLASEAAFEQNVTRLRSQVLDCKGTSRLWRSAERDLLRSWPAVSLDEFVALRDWWWFRDQGPQAPLPLVDYVQQLARRLLRVQGNQAVPHLVTEPSSTVSEARSRLAWRWFSLALPSQLLLAALGDGARRPRRLQLLSPNLRQALFDEGYAETHLHLFAALDFETVWVITLLRLASSQLRASEFESPGACFQEGKLLGPWLQRAAIGRALLAAFLGSGRGDLRGYLSRQGDAWTRELGLPRVELLVRALSDLEQGQLAPSPLGPKASFAALGHLYQQLVGHSMRQPERLDDIAAWDPIAPLLSWSQAASPEQAWLQQGYRHLRAHPEDALFAALFWQIVRLQVLYFRHLVHRPMTPGLQWFTRTFQRMDAGQGDIETQLGLDGALRQAGYERGLRSLEVRFAPSSNLMRRLLEVEEYVHPSTSQRRPDLPELGIVLHFPRARGGGWARGQPNCRWRYSHADPSLNLGSLENFYRSKKENSRGFRYAQYYYEQRERAEAVVRALGMYPGAVYWLRGVDVCTDELGVPAWVLAPLLRYVRAAGEGATRELYRREGLEVPCLRTTAHAGEDYIHLATGLRLIDEAIEHFELQAGDRLGHALALGIDAERWAQRSGRIVMPRGDRLFDLVWELEIYASGADGVEVEAERVEYARAQIAHLSREIFGQSLRRQELCELQQALRDEGVLRRLGFPYQLIPPREVTEPTSALARTWRYLTDPDLLDRDRAVIEVEPSGEARALLRMQRWLRRKVADRGLVIEANPSSNLLVGNLADLREHPLWRLRPPEPGQEEVPLEVCLGSDDPLPFNTDLRSEYQLLHDALVLADHTPAQADAWLRQLRQTGLRARFTRPVRSDFALRAVVPSLVPSDVPLPP